MRQLCSLYVDGVHTFWRLFCLKSYSITFAQFIELYAYKAL